VWLYLQVQEILCPSVGVEIESMVIL